jgi:hypothetical protein
LYHKFVSISRLWYNFNQFWLLLLEVCPSRPEHSNIFVRVQSAVKMLEHQHLQDLSLSIAGYPFYTWMEWGYFVQSAFSKDTTSRYHSHDLNPQPPVYSPAP